MSNDPQDPPRDGREDLQNRKTRLIMRPDIAEPERSSGDAASGRAAPPAGTVIGKARDAGALVQTADVPPARKHQAVHTRILKQETVETAAPVAGWIVVVKGPGRGAFRPVYVGMNALGRAPSQRIAVDFGDETISREEHAFITYDDETRTFYLQHGGKSNLVRLGGQPVLTPVVLKPNDFFRIGNTTFRFVPCCGPDFCWTSEIEDA